MIGLIGIILIIVVFGGIGFVSGWLFAIWDERSGILSSPKRFLCYLLGLAVLFLVLFGDEIIGKIQFDELCRKAEFKLLVDEAELNNKRLIAYRTKRIRIQNTWVPIQYIRYEYKDETLDKTYFISASYSVSGGWVANIVTLGSGYPLVLKNTFCDAPQYMEFQKKYNFSVIDTK
ncbi:hypothetical protein [Neisseria yangbaofengii]|uniref:hypothetical protein n=1 Tax=Neisseria yangbaofengii TaxID=2709396 RepID=UPI0013E9E98C|nr:hypothetical protein [Neisseria yangbaofengii]